MPAAATTNAARPTYHIRKRSIPISRLSVYATGYTAASPGKVVLSRLCPSWSDFALIEPRVLQAVSTRRNNQNGKKIGIAITPATQVIRLSGTPTLTKSMYLYSPIWKTRTFVW